LVYPASTLFVYFKVSQQLLSPPCPVLYVFDSTRWWKSILSTPGGSHSLVPHYAIDPDVWVDASSSPREPDIMGMGIGHWNWPDDISLAQLIGLSLEDMTPNRTNSDTTQTLYTSISMDNDHN